MENWWNGGHKVEGSPICRFRAKDGGKGVHRRHLINEALHLILVLITWCVEIVYTHSDSVGYTLEWGQCYNIFGLNEAEI